MSIKARKFESMLGNPLNTHNFIVIIPKLTSIQMMISATTFPSETLQVYTMFFQGERVKFPSLPTNAGTWSAAMPEGEFAKMFTALENHMATQYNQQTGIMSHWAIRDKFDIEVYARGLRGDVDGSDRVFGVRLRGAFMTGKSDVSLNFNAVTTPWEWNVQFSYDSPEMIAATPLGPPSLA